MSVMPEHIEKMKIKVQGGKEYLPVAARMLWFRQDHPDWSIVTEAVVIDGDKHYAIFRASILDTDNRVIATATKKEDVKGFGDYVEKAETGSVGRALAYAGYGTLSDEDAMQESPVASRQVDSAQPAKSKPAQDPGVHQEALKLVALAAWPNSDEAERLSIVWDIAVAMIGKEPPDPKIKESWPRNTALIADLMKKISEDTLAK